MTASTRRKAKAISTDGWEIAPFAGIGPIRFGMTREEVRGVLGVPEPDPSGWEQQDFFHFPYPDSSGVSIKVHYSEQDGLCGFVQIHGGSEDSARSLPRERRFGPGGATGPMLEGRGLLGRPYDRALAWFRERDPGVHLDPEGLRSDALGVAVWAPAASREPAGPIESVSAFTSAYGAEFFSP